MSINKILRYAGTISRTKSLETLGISPILVDSLKLGLYQVNYIVHESKDIILTKHSFDVKGFISSHVNDIICRLNSELLNILMTHTNNIEDVVFYHNIVHECVVQHCPQIQNIVCSSNALKEQSEKINPQYRMSSVITPYINEIIYRNYSEDRRNKCLSIQNSPAPLSYKSELIDSINIEMPFVEIFNQYEACVITGSEANTEWPLAAMLCGCIPILVKDGGDYNESIFRNGETCFVVESTEELLDSINLIVTNAKLARNIRKNISEIVSLFNNKEKFLDSWTSVIKEIK
jgi:hypothetical protein